MPTGFTKSPEGEEEYKKLGLEYPDSLQDELYEQWLKDTTAKDLEQYTRHKEKEVLSIVRVRTGIKADGSDQKEFLYYNLIHYRMDKDLNVALWVRAEIGIFPIPRAAYKTTIGAFGKQERQVSEIVAIEKNYSILSQKRTYKKY